MTVELKLGITEGGVMHTDADPDFQSWDIEKKFRMVKEVGIYDYLDKTPGKDEAGEYLRCSEHYDLPILAGGWFYTLGRDEQLLEDNLRLGAFLGSRIHNTQIMMDHADGRLVTDDEVVEIYLRAYEIGEKFGCIPAFEVHVNMWSEDFRRIGRVADRVESKGIPYYMTLDHSHVIFKIDNPQEQEVFNIREDIESGDLILNPFIDGNVCDEWIERGIVAHCHARASIPNNPRNVWQHHPSLNSLPSSLHPKDTIGRGIQYPFIRPEPGQWHSEWDEEQLEPWKEVVRSLLRHHANQSDSPLHSISTEFIPHPDYGGGAKYSIFEHSVACAEWIKGEWGKIIALV